MWKYVLLGGLMVGVVVYGFSLIEVGGSGEISARAALLAPDPDIGGYARAVGPWDWQFPADYGPHPEFQTEWWYYTGNLATEEGRRFGYQLTIFRRAITPQPPDDGASEWRSNQVYMAHFTLTDVQGERFYQPGERGFEVELGERLERFRRLRARQASASKEHDRGESDHPAGE